LLLGVNGFLVESPGGLEPLEQMFGLSHGFVGLIRLPHQLLNASQLQVSL